MSKRKPYDPGDRAIPFSRSALEEFLRCPHCFYLHRRLGIRPPSGPMSGLPSVVDALLKKEFDAHRAAQTQHPVMTSLPGDLVPFTHPDFAGWRKRSPGIRLLHRASGFEVFGSLDDVWRDRGSDALFVVDYKTIAFADGPPAEVNEQYRRQVETYQWLLRGNGFHTSPTAYLLFETADRTSPNLDRGLVFHRDVVSLVGDPDWVAGLLIMARYCLDADVAPDPSDDCTTCIYFARRSAV